MFHPPYSAAGHLAIPINARSWTPPLGRPTAALPTQPVDDCLGPSPAPSGTGSAATVPFDPPRQAKAVDAVTLRSESRAARGVGAA